MTTLARKTRRAHGMPPPRRRIMARPAGEQRPVRRYHPRQQPPRRRWLVPALIAGIALAAVVGVNKLPGLAGVALAPSPTPGAASPAAPGAARPATSAATAAPPAGSPASSSSTTAPGGVAGLPGDRPAGPPTGAPPTPASPTPDPMAAPTTAADFDQKHQVIAIGFPLRAETRYRYRDNWGDLREGEAESYNHAHSRQGRQVLRAHDGIDLYADEGEPVLAPFSGLVIDPAERWRPWVPERYGLTAVIVSEESTSRSYVALLSHLDRLWIEPGQRVRRGEVIGTVGATGNADGGPAHVHFELRAPFLLEWLELGEKRLVDAFNPFPSLVAADPNRSD